MLRSSIVVFVFSIFHNILNGVWNDSALFITTGMVSHLVGPQLNLMRLCM